MEEEVEVIKRIIDIIKKDFPNYRFIAYKIKE